LTDATANTVRPRLALVEIGGDRQIAVGGELVGLAPDVIVEPEHLVNHHDAGPRGVVVLRRGQIARKSQVTDWNGDIRQGHTISWWRWLR